MAESGPNPWGEEGAQKAGLNVRAQAQAQN